MGRTIASFAVVAVLMVLASEASASIQAGDSIVLGWPSFSPHGSEGPFQITKVGSGESFLTFCVELTQYFSPGNTYYVESTGVETQDTPHYLSGYTAWIYAMFRQENGWHLPSSFAQEQTKMGQAQYNVLQYAVWSGMTNVPPTQASVGVNAEQVIGQFNSYLNATYCESDLEAYGIGRTNFENSDWGGAGISIEERYKYTGNVVVLNLTDLQNHTADNQDQLGLSDTPFRAHAPEPASLIVWSSIGMISCLAVWRRKKVAAKQQNVSLLPS